MPIEFKVVEALLDTLEVGEVPLKKKGPFPIPLPQLLTLVSVFPIFCRDFRFPLVDSLFFHYKL